MRGAASESLVTHILPVFLSSTKLADKFIGNSKHSSRHLDINGGYQNSAVFMCIDSV